MLHHTWPSCVFLRLMQHSLLDSFWYKGWNLRRAQLKTVSEQMENWVTWLPTTVAFRAGPALSVFWAAVT